MRLKKIKLATPQQRLSARVLDIIFQIAPLAAIALIVYAYIDVEAQTTIAPEVVRRAALLIGLFASWLIIHIVQWVLIASRGQSLGKLILHIKIVDDTSHKNAGAVRNLVLRTWLNALMLGNLFYFLVDSLLILRKDRKCLHDFIARTLVVRI